MKNEQLIRACVLGDERIAEWQWLKGHRWTAQRVFELGMARAQRIQRQLNRRRMKLGYGLPAFRYTRRGSPSRFYIDPVSDARVGQLVYILGIVQASRNTVRLTWQVPGYGAVTTLAYISNIQDEILRRYGIGTT